MLISMVVDNTAKIVLAASIGFFVGVILVFSLSNPATIELALSQGGGRPHKSTTTTTIATSTLPTTSLSTTSTILTSLSTSVSTTTINAITTTSTVTSTTIAQRYLNMIVNPTGYGTTTPVGNNIYPMNSAVSISATAGTNHTFVNWTCSGTFCYAGTNSISSVTLVTDITEIANFR